MNLQTANSPIENHLRHLRPFLNEEGVTEVCINKPGQVLVEKDGGWFYYDVPELSFMELEGLSKTIAAHSQQKINAQHPILSATLPDGERVQVVRPPVTLPGIISLTIRKPPSVRYTLEDYVNQGAFEETRAKPLGLTDEDLRLKDLKETDPATFLKVAVQARKNIIVSGSTGSGKTTLMRSLVDLVPQDERLISIENVDEMMLYESHSNSVSLFYSAGNQGQANVSQKELIESALRMKPNRVFVAELIRGEEAFYFLRNVNSGHPGSITSMHSGSPKMAIEQLVLFLKESAGSSLSRGDIKSLIEMAVDVIVQINVVDGKRKITEIYYEPERKLSAVQ